MTVDHNKFRVICVIPARWGSTRFPGKPLADIGGKSMILRVWEQCIKAREIHELIVATDDERIFREVVDFGGRAVMTSAKCKNGTERLVEMVSMNEADEKKEEIWVNVQGDEPFIPPRNISLLVRELIKKKAEVGTLAIKFKNADEAKDVNKVKVVFDKERYALYFSRSIIPFNRENEKEIVYFKHIGIYAYTRRFLEKIKFMRKTRLEEAEKLEQLKFLEYGTKMLVAVTKWDSISVDTKEDLLSLKI